MCNVIVPLSLHFTLKFTIFSGRKWTLKGNLLYCKIGYTSASRYCTRSSLRALRHNVHKELFTRFIKFQIYRLYLSCFWLQSARCVSTHFLTAPNILREFLIKSCPCPLKSRPNLRVWMRNGFFAEINFWQKKTNMAWLGSLALPEKTGLDLANNYKRVWSGHRE